MNLLYFKINMATTNQIEDRTQDLATKELATQDIAKTIAKKESLMMLGIRELFSTFSGWSKNIDKNDSDEHQISEKTEQYEKERSNQRPPIIPN